MIERALQHLASLPRLGWVEGPSPVVSLASLAEELHVESLWVKRDDALGLARGLHGGTKVRKLDVLLAAPPWNDAPSWSSVGAIGSGHLVALSTAARVLGRSLRAHLFWEPPLPEHLENLAFVASGPGSLRFSHSRVAMSLRDPGVLLAKRQGEAAVIPPGATCPVGEMGVALGAIELAKQIEEGLCPAPSNVFVPLGSGGTLVGLLVGFALTGLGCTVHAVAVVEHIFSLERVLVSRAKKLLASLGAGDVKLPPLRIHRAQLGRGYGVATRESLRECERLRREDVGLEPIYSGKTMAGLRAAAPSLRGPTLFWLTPRKPGPLPAESDWRARLPKALRERLDEYEHPRLITRRRVLLAGVGSVSAVAIARMTVYPAPPHGLSRLGRSAAALLGAAAEVVITPAPSRAVIDDMLRRIDRYVASQPREIRVQIDGAITLVEQCPLGVLGRWARFSGLSREDRLRVLDALVARGGVAAEAGRAVRDLTMVGYYQRAESWSRLAYRGPWVSRDARPDAYASFHSDALPAGFEADR